MSRRIVLRNCEYCGNQFRVGKGMRSLCSLPCRLWRRVNKLGPVPAHLPQLGNCWVWLGSKDSSGYGRINTGSRSDGTRRSSAHTHRVVWEMAHGPTDLFCLHHCDNPSCVNPEHMFLGTNEDNVRDMVCKGRADRARKLRGESASWSVLTEEAVKRIRDERSRGTRLLVLAREYGVSIGTISLAALGKNWRHV